ncbi:MAG: leucine-rich repeat domain-containing protein [Paludibacteraceae bacterium]|nr:leucine-rich repeat domain-containing protein [Paludibacteraceae bacterium]
MKKFTINRAHVAKKISLFICALCASVLTVTAQVYVDGIAYECSYDGENYTAGVIQGENPYTGDIVIPDSIEDDGHTYSVIEIKDNAFQYSESLNSVVLPKTMKKIGSEAFHNCVNMTSIALNEGLEEIGSDAFGSCEKLESLTLPSTLKYIRDWAFEHCYSLKSLTLPEGLEEVGGNICTADTPEAPVYNSKFFAFLPYDYAENYTVPDGIEIICGDAFKDNKSLKSVSLPTSVKLIRYEAFVRCENLTSITLNEGLEIIEYGAFSYTSLTTIALPASLNYIDPSALPGTTEAVTIAAGNENYSATNYCLIEKSTGLLIYAGKGATLPEGITEIGISAFKDRTDLTTFVVPSTVQSIGSYAFSGCSNLTNITLPEGLKWISSGMFDGCSSLKSVTLPSTITNLDNAEYLFKNCSQLENVTILCPYTYIPNNFFLYCDSLKSFNLPESVQGIGSEAFRYIGLTSPVSNSHLFARLPENYQGAFAIPEGTTKIGNHAFYNCDSLTEISFPSTLTDIDFEAFWGCTLLKRIELPEGVERIGSYAFEDCHDVETLILPSTVTLIEGSAFAFRSESKLKEVYNYAVTPCEFYDWDNHPFFEVPNIDQIKLYVPKSSVDDYKAAYRWQDFDVQPMPEVATGLVNGEAKAAYRKTLRNGQLLIKKNGHIYNAQGALIR